MKDWKEIYGNLPDTEKDKIAVLRVMECTNGIIQHSFRDKEEWALPIEETRKAMKFSMSCMKNLAIPLKDETITFEPETQELLREARNYYISGVKNGNDEDFALERIMNGVKILKENVDDIPADKLHWGVAYLMQFFK
jgi:hypothetical protein